MLDSLALRLRRLQLAPLKPQQKLRILRDHLIPRKGAALVNPRVTLGL